MVMGMFNHTHMSSDDTSTQDSYPLENVNFEIERQFALDNGQFRLSPKQLDASSFAICAVTHFTVPWG